MEDQIENLRYKICMKQEDTIAYFIIVQVEVIHSFIFSSNIFDICLKDLLKILESGIPSR